MTGASGVQNRKASVSSAPATRSALVIDCGSVFTRVALLDLVDGRHRLLAMSTVPTTSTPPYADVLQGIHAAIAELERLTARSLLREGQVLTPEQESGDGVDAVALTVSVGGPLRLLTTGSGRDALAALVYRATTGFFTALEPLAQEASPTSASGAYDAWETQVAQQRSRPPHAVLVVGPSREGQRARPDMSETARVLAAWTAAMRAQEGEPRPEIPVLFTGMPADGAMLQHALADQAHVQMMEPLSPTALAPLSQAVATLYANAVVRAIPGYAGLRGLNSSFPVAATTALGEAVRLLGQHYSMNVVGVDAGASATVLVGASAQGGVLTAIQPAAGVGPGAGAVLRAAGAASVLRWLPDTVEEAELREYVLKRMLRP
ncbi:MAG TPA: glutamate mutase L, partial [Ktedonobacterales bacterium]